MGTVMGLVPAIAPIGGGLLQDWAGWRSTFAVIVLFGLALGGMVVALLPETLRSRAAAPLSFAAILRGFGSLLRHPAYRVYVALCSLAYGGLFAFISGSSFVLQGVYGLEELPYAFSFAFTVLGFIAGTLVAQRTVARRGLDGTIGLGVAAMALGGATMLLLVVSGVPSSLAITAPMALYTAGFGLTMPQTVAAAMLAFGERAGAASSLLGICQMTFAALVGAGVGQALGGSALPLPFVTAAIGVIALLLFCVSAKVRGG
jgi:MFS transporter, DHA1 family, multidrug resistance protein